jgi:hypothetical protein
MNKNLNAFHAHIDKEKKHTDDAVQSCNESRIALLALGKQRRLLLSASKTGTKRARRKRRTTRT